MSPAPCLAVARRRPQAVGPVPLASLALLVALLACDASSSPAGSDAPDSPDSRQLAVPARASGGALTAPVYGAEFSAHWHDGKAELVGYRLRFPRYGHVREGTAVAIFVTEDQRPDTRVKPEAKRDDAFPVLKLNLVQDFQTGIYDYNLMTSVFVTTRAAAGLAAGVASKLSFSAQEWCGHVYMQALFDAERVRLTSHSYFEGEADARTELALSGPVLAEDALLLWARGLAAPAVAPGATVSEVPVLLSLANARLGHRPVTLERATLSRAAETERLTISAGSAGSARELEVRRARARVSRGDGAPARWTFWVEVARPRRLVRVKRDDGLELRLLASKRLPYWQLQSPGKEALLSELGLTAKVSPAPDSAPAPR